MVKKIAVILFIASIAGFAQNSPIMISGSCLSPVTVQIKFTNYQTVAPPSPLVSADSVGLWYKAGALPPSPSQSNFIKYYTLQQMLSRGSVFADTITVPQLAAGDSMCGFMNAVLWSDKTTSSFSAGNGCLVLMRDTFPIPNDLIISGVYVPDDTAWINLDNLASIDTSRIDTIGIWYGLVNDSANFGDNSSCRWVSARDVIQAGIRYKLAIVNPIFNIVEKTVYAAVVCKGKNDRMSPVNKTSFIVGKPRPVNPVNLFAKTLSAARIMLSWNNIAGTGAERLIIWYRPFLPVPLVYDVSALGLDSVVPSVADTQITVSGLLEKARYYFGAQIYKGGLWSYITDSASASDSTDPACCGQGVSGKGAHPIKPYVNVARTIEGVAVFCGDYGRGEVSAAVYSARGQEIARMNNSENGRNMMTWNFTDRNGNHAKNGIYLMEIKAGSTIITQRIILTR